MTTGQQTDPVYIGWCKMFSRGYGFITAVEGPLQGQDFFVHHTGIRPQVSTFRTLRKGEYVHFQVVDSVSTPGKQQAVNVTGINGFPLMCDTMLASQQHHQRQQQHQLPQAAAPEDPAAELAA